MFIKYLTDIGKVRELNEDYVLVHSIGKEHLIIVADGMGGHNAGEIASELAANTIKDYVLEGILSCESREELIRDAIVNANMKVYEKSINSDNLRGMGTTVTCGIIGESKLYLGHVGDSRGYILNREKIEKITQDHSYVQELINNGTITEDEALKHPQRNIITRAVGIDKYVVIDTSTINIGDDDIIVFCSDGLTSYVNSDELKRIVIDNKDKAEYELINLAKERGGKDNISVIIARKEEKI